uniref:CvpA family protein n=1 Tax=candidate division WOR-3 bacterium TaxID=2052148 RepID=A0A7C6A8T6_UNCW3
MLVNIVIVAIVAIFVIFGLRNGFIKWMAVTLGIIIGFWLASQKYLVLEKFLLGLVHSSEKAHIIGFFLVFLLFFFIIVLIGYLLSKVVNLTLLGWLDRLLGAIFGLVAGLIFVWLLLVLAITLQPQSQRPLSKSALAPRILEAGQKVSGLPLGQKIRKKYLTFAPKPLLFEGLCPSNSLSFKPESGLFEGDKNLPKADG